ncbi:UNVERIFIED_CONTAM: hypothetical protein Sradi_2523800 [Sesamum radiatum]|uniref:Uncharacterized protein n=1 Tax=Sesamum radiatum TaxID=300843 RepID=A0AAW2SKG3_SESRA
MRVLNGNPSNTENKQKAVDTSSKTQTLQAVYGRDQVPRLRHHISSCFNQLLIGAIGSFQEFRSLFLHQFASSRKLKKIELSLFAVSQKDNEPLKEYLQRFNTASQEVPSATQEVKASAFSQGLLDGHFFKSLAKKTVSKFDALLARAAKYINMEDAQAAKKRVMERKKSGEGGSPHQKAPSRGSGQEVPFLESERSIHCTNCTYHPGSFGCRRKRPIGSTKSWRDGPHYPKSDKFCSFHNIYDHTTEACRHLKNEIKTLIQNGYLREYVCREKARGVVVTSPHGEDLEFAVKFDFKASNNEAEYKTLLIGMKMTHGAGAKYLVAYSDSQLVVKQVEGIYEAKEKTMIQYLQQIAKLRTSFESIQLTQIPREDNIKAYCSPSSPVL